MLLFFQGVGIQILSCIIEKLIEKWYDLIEENYSWLTDERGNVTVILVSNA